MAPRTDDVADNLDDPCSVFHLPSRVNKVFLTWILDHELDVNISFDPLLSKKRRIYYYLLLEVVWSALVIVTISVFPTSPYAKALDIYVYCAEFVIHSINLALLKRTQRVEVICVLEGILFTVCVMVSAKRIGGRAAFACTNHLVVPTIVYLLGTKGVPVALIINAVVIASLPLVENSEESNIVVALNPGYLLWQAAFCYINEASHNQIRKELKIASEYKNMFLSKMSHELRTPLHGIVGAVELLKLRLSSSTSELKELMKIIENCNHCLLSLINDVLDLAKITSGRLELQRRKTDLQTVIKIAIDVIHSDIVKKNLNLAVNVDPKLPAVVEIDDIKLSQILINILSNAVKFTPNGGSVTLSATLIAGGGPTYSDCTIQFEVKDTGIGFDQASAATLFKAFERGRCEINREFGGTGLGLAIARQLAKAMGGSITARSPGPGQGATFTVLVPHITVLVGPSSSPVMTHTDTEKAEAKCSNKQRILMAEDNVVNQVIGAKMLNHLGYEVDVVENGLEAVKSVVSHPPDYYRLVLLDLEMPVLDGCEAAMQIRARDRKIPLVALSAHAFVRPPNLEDKVFNAFLSKPVLLESLESCINNLKVQ